VSDLVTIPALAAGMIGSIDRR